MNRDIATLREAIVKITQILSENSVLVTQQGIQAFVQYNEDGSIKRLNLPYIPDNAGEDLILSIQGFLDHEVAHILFTDSSVIMKAAKEGPLVAGMHNIVEDTFIERMMMKKFRGSRYNLDRLHEFFLTEIVGPGIDDAIAAKNDADTMNRLIVVMCRAWSGQEIFDRYMKVGNKWDLEVVQKATAAIGPDLIARFPLLESSEQAYALTLEIVEILKGLMPPPPPGGGEGDEKGKGDGSKKSKPKKSSSDKDDDTSDEDKGEPSKGDDKDETDGDGKSGDDPDPEGEDKEDEGADGSEKEGDGDPSKGESGDEDDGGGKSDGPHDGEDDEGDKTEGSRPDEDAEGSWIDGLDMDKLTEALEEDFHDAIAGALSTEEETASSEYRVFTKDFDKIETYPVRKDNSSAVKELDDQCRQMVGVMQKDLERIMQARSMTHMAPGHRSGRLHSAALHRLTTGDDRVFRRKTEIVNKDIAVSLLVDCSGSMGRGKYETAIISAFALSQTLERIGISHEVLGFTTDGHSTVAGGMPIKKIMNEQETRMGVRFSRREPIYMPIFKSFDERLTQQVKQRFAASMSDHFKANNIDGECVEIATQRLSKRREKRKVLIVLSDGSPLADGNTREQSDHLRKTVAAAPKWGVECIGIGIQSDAVSRYYPKYTVLKSLDELPGQVMRDLRNVLIAA